jgi:hypothetical protein
MPIGPKSIAGAANSRPLVAPKQEQLGSSKFMKTYRCKSDGVPVVVKVYIKRDPEEVMHGGYHDHARSIKLISRLCSLSHSALSADSHGK